MNVDSVVPLCGVDIVVIDFEQEPLLSKEENNKNNLAGQLLGEI